MLTEQLLTYCTRQRQTFVANFVELHGTVMEPYFQEKVPELYGSLQWVWWNGYLNYADTVADPTTLLLKPIAVPDNAKIPVCFLQNHRRTTAPPRCQKSPLRCY